MIPPAMLGKQNPQSQNLIKQVSATEITRPPGFYKSIVVDVLGVVLALSTGLVYWLYLADRASFFSVAIVAGLFALAAFFGALLMKNPQRRAIVMIGYVAGILLFFYDAPFATIAYAAVALFVFLTWGDFVLRRELDNMLEIRFLRLAHVHLKKATTALVLAGVLLYLPQWQPEDAFLSESAYAPIFESATNITSRFYGDITTNSTIENFITTVANRQIKDDPTYTQASQKQKDTIFTKIRDSVAERLRAAVSRNFDVKETTFREFTYQWIVDALRRWHESFREKFLFAWAIAAFLAVRSAGVIFYGATAALGFLVYHILIASNVISIVGETHVRESIRYL